MFLFEFGWMWFFPESKSPDILALSEKNLDNLIVSGNFSVRGYLLLVQRDFTYMHGLVVHLKEGLPFAWDLPLENSVDSNLCFQLTLLRSMSYFFPLLITYFIFMHAWFLMLWGFWSNVDEVLLINPCANVFVFNLHHKDWLTYSGRTDRPGILYHFSNDLTQKVNFPTRIPDCDSQSCSFGFIYFFWY